MLPLAGIKENKSGEREDSKSSRRLETEDGDKETNQGRRHRQEAEGAWQTNTGEKTHTHRRSSHSAEGDTRAGLPPRGQHHLLLPAAERETIPLSAARELLR